MANEYALLYAIQAAKEPGGIAGDAKKLGLLLTNSVKIKLSHPGTGRIYKSRMKNVGGHRAYDPTSPGHLHQASAPGEPPAVDTGALRASYTWDVEERPNLVILSVGTPDEVGLFLEFGTRHILARPHLRPAVAENAAAIGPVLAEGIVRRQRETARRHGGRG